MAEEWPEGLREKVVPIVERYQAKGWEITSGWLEQKETSERIERPKLRLRARIPGRPVVYRKSFDVNDELPTTVERFLRGLE